jgi:hypothetical protein
VTEFTAEAQRAQRTAAEGLFRFEMLADYEDVTETVVVLCGSSAVSASLR